MKTNRRKFIQNIGLSTAALSVGAAGSASAANTAKEAPDKDGQILLVGDNIAVAATTHGKVRGFVLRGINTFLGIPYGADTSGANRFMPPQKPKSWDGVLPAVWWGNTAPQNMEKRYSNVYASFVDHWNYDDVSEDCLKLNVWTPALGDGKKRPVMVWLHGGGYANGNAIEQDGYHGENFSRRGDTVFVSINHRLGPLGYAHFGAAGSKFAASGNVGMLDCVAALEWVRDNIASFGGDPGNVTIMGQSGGGAKVCVLTAMPAAKGLFHKAVALSGSSLKAVEKENAEKLAEYVLNEAGLTYNEMDKLQEMPWKQYLEFATRGLAKYREEMKMPAFGGGGGFAPVVDGTYLPQHPYNGEPAPAAADVPMLICTTFNEQSPSRTDSGLETIDLGGVKDKLKGRFGDKTGDIVEAYAKVFPDKRPIEIWSMVASNRQNAIALADSKSKQKAPVYIAWFGWQPPMFDNRMRAFHCVDICFWYYNTDIMLTHTGGGARPRKLSTKMADSLLNFMKTGNPNGGGLPNWPAYNSANGQTMVLDDMPVVKNDPDREARKAFV
ncbi:MAG TPA: carboxylesterase family protein [Cyclobacteriaceae bacterium]|nr:carboxylesterase family protein [Cyclobacteriaceae bacterium]